MENALNAFIKATTEAEVRAAYEAMLQWSAAAEGYEDIDNMLNARGLDSLSARLLAVTV